MIANYILILLTVHYIADWGLQNQFMADNKGKFWIVMASHCMIWAGSLSVALMVLGLFEWWKFVFLFVLHYLIDAWKMKNIRAYCSQDPRETKHNLTLLYIDQALHALQCVYVLI